MSPGPWVPSPLSVMAPISFVVPFVVIIPGVSWHCRSLHKAPILAPHHCASPLLPAPYGKEYWVQRLSILHRMAAAPEHLSWGGVGGAPVCCHHLTPLPSWGSCLVAQPRGSAGPPRPRAVATQRGPSCQARGVGELEQRSLCAQAPEPALYDLQALPSLQPGSRESYSSGLAWGRGAAPPLLGTIHEW